MRLGAHDSIAGGVWNAAEEAAAIGGETMQIFCKNQRQWNAKPLSEEDAKRFQDAVAAAGLERVMVHDSYLINMGSPDPEKGANAAAAFRRELERCEQLQVAYLNFHPGSHTHKQKAMRDDRATRFAALDRIAGHVNDVLDAVPGDVMAVIENAAGQGTNVGNSWEEVGYLADRLEDQKRVGICIDTQHSWACGYDWRDDYDGVWDEFASQVGFKRLVAFHLNDSKQPLGARVDRHDNIGDGHLGPDFFATLVQDPRFKDLCGYLETPGGPEVWAQELRLLKALRAGETVTAT